MWHVKRTFYLLLLSIRSLSNGCPSLCCIPSIIMLTSSALRYGLAGGWTKPWYTYQNTNCHTPQLPHNKASSEIGSDQHLSIVRTELIHPAIFHWWGHIVHFRKNNRSARRQQTTADEKNYHKKRQPRKNCTFWVSFWVLIHTCSIPFDVFPSESSANKKIHIQN